MNGMLLGRPRLPRRPGDDVLVDLIAATVHAETLEHAWAATVTAFRTLGFAHVIYLYSPDSHGSELGSTDDHLRLSTLDPQVMSDLVSRNFYSGSVSFHWALHNAGVISWSIGEDETAPRPDQPMSDEALAFYERAGLQTGCTVGFAKTRTRGIAAMALSLGPGVAQAEFDQVLPALKETIFLVASVAHRTLISLPWQHPSGGLTNRQREVLEWVGEGKTTADVACIMGLTPATVEKHLRLARHCLKVETTAHALVKATFLNQVYVRVSRRADRR
jgi:DNA-binding CsgD family transcriptional regulator